MIKQSLAFDDIIEKKFKILRTSIMLGNFKNRDEILSDYEDTAREIDKIKRNVYEELLASKMYTTTSLEEEQTRLSDLIEFIERRILERNEFIDDYIKITSNFLDDLPKVSLESELLDYKVRLDNICEYLDNCKEIETLNRKLKKLRDELQEKYESKANNEIINSKLEDELVDEFNKIISRSEYYSGLNYTDIDDELVKLDKSLLDKKDVMETFSSSYDALKAAGISGAEREEYLSYVQDSRLDYYSDLEKKYILNIYKLVLDKENDYDRLYEKRLRIEAILEEREKARSELDISSRDELQYFVNLCREQFSVIKAQRFNIDNIDKIILEISNCEDRLEELQLANDRVEIVSLLNEFSVVKPEIEKIELPEEKEVHDEVVEKNIKMENPKPANMVVRIQEPIKMNVKTASDTAKLVMKKVVIVLEPKKFNGKRDKLKEAELELEERKRREKIEAQEKKLQMEMDALNEKELEEETIQEEVVENTLEEKEEDIFEQDVNDIFEDDDFVTPPLDVTLDTREVEDRKVKDTLELDDTEVKINSLDNQEIVIPTEIFIEEPKEEVVDLFKETDPFLDDNEFELDKLERNENGMITNMPMLGKIGSVKPNNMLSKIEDVQQENDDIILPTMGLMNEEKVDVPIVSENYIN